MFKIKTSLIQGFTALLITSSSLWATPNHDDDNAQAVVSRGMEAPAIQGSASGSTSPSTSSTSTDLGTPALDLFVPVTVSEGVIASAARQSTDLVTTDNVWPPKWSPIEDENALANLPRLVLNEIFQWLLWTDDVDNIKKAAFLNRYWHRYTQSMEFKNLFLNAIDATTGGDSNDTPPDHPEQLFKGHRTYFKTFENRKLIEFFKNKTFEGALEITAPWGQYYRTDYEKTRRVAHNPRKTSLSLYQPYNGNSDLIKSLRLSPTVHFDLGKLTCLNLKGNKLKILPDLTRMTNLQVLNLESNDLMELPHLGTLTNLKALLLGTNFVTEIPGLSALSQLKALDVSDTPLAHLEGLENLSALRSFTAVWHVHLHHNLDDKSTWGPRGKPVSNTLTNLSALEHLTALRELRLQGFMVSAFPPLTRLTNLESLNLENLGISEVPGLENLTSLQELWLQNYKSVSIQNKEIPASQYYSTNKFTSLPNLSRLINLQALICEHLNLGQISGLGSLTKLKELALSGNQLTRLEGLEKLVKLNYLYIHENPIESLPDLRSLQNLCGLSVERTPLTALEGLDQLTSLEWVHSSDNHQHAPAIMSSLDRLTQLQALRNMPVLSIVFGQ